MIHGDSREAKDIMQKNRIQPKRKFKNLVFFISVLILFSSNFSYVIVTDAKNIEESDSFSKDLSATSLIKNFEKNEEKQDFADSQINNTKSIDVHGNSNEFLFPNNEDIDKECNSTIFNSVFSSKHEIIISFEIGDLIQTSVETPQGTFTLLKIQNCSFTTEVGKSQLPIFTQLLAVPTTDVFFEIINTSSHKKTIGKIYPAQEPQTDSFIDGENEFIINEAFYNSDENYPQDIAEIAYKGNLRDIPFVRIGFSPIQYNPRTEQVTIYEKIEVKISWNDSEKVSMENNYEKSSFFNFYKNVFVNWDEFQKNIDFVEKNFNKNSTGCEYLILTHPIFLSAANDLAEWKKKTGILTKVVDTTETGGDNESIRQYIQDAYDTWNPAPSYVLLIGDAEYIPTNYFTDTGTDLWYATVSGSDYYPDLFIGRISVDYLYQANIIVQKIIGYEQDPPSETWFYKDVTVAAYFQDSLSPYGYEDRRFIKTSEEIRNFLLTEDYDVERIYCTPASVNPTNYNDNYYAHGEPIPSELLRENGFTWEGDYIDIINAINQGSFIVNHRDHGGVQGWGDPYFDTSHIASLSNGDLLPIVFSINCLTGYFDYEYGESFCEEFLRKANGGTVGIVGASRISYSGYNDYLCRGFYDAIWPDFDLSQGGTMPLYKMGEVLNYGKLYMANTWGDLSLEFELFHWFGDPTMEIWTDIPASFDVQHPSTLPEGISSFTVHVEEVGGGNVQDAYVCLWKDDEVYLRDYTNSNGDVTFNPSPGTIGTMYVTVTKHNYLPFEGETLVKEIVFVDDDYNPSTPGWGYDHFRTIQDGINSTDSGEFVFVYNGTYYENVFIDNSIILIGEDRNNTIIDGGGSGTVLNIYVDSVTIKGFTIRNSGNEPDNKGIYSYSDGISIVDNNIISNYYGIHFQISSNNLISGNMITENMWGIGFSWYMSDNTITENEILNNNIGIWMYYSCNNNIVYDNIVSENNDYGIVLYTSCTSNIIYDNNIINNFQGINLWSSCNNNIFYHNIFLNNTQNVYDFCNNIWDNGYPSGGNYWDDYIGIDEDGDGIGDTPYNIPGVGNQDMCPLMHYDPRPDTVFIDDNYTASTPGWSYDHFNKIQYGIDMVQENGTVYVYNGTYYENLIVNKTVDLIGEDKDNTVIDGSGNDDVVYITADAVTIHRFTIQNSGSDWNNAGINVQSNFNLVSGNTISSSYIGIFLDSSNNILSSNTILSTWYGIYLDTSSNNNIVDNNINVYNSYGIRLSLSNNNCISDNNISNSNDGNGLLIYSSHDNEISGNNISNNYVGINLYFSSTNSIFVNTINSNHDEGLELWYSDSNIVYGNIIKENEDEGIYIYYSSLNKIFENKIEENAEYGIHIVYYSNNNIIYNNNLIDNNPNAHDEWSNRWDNTYAYGGNYWDDYIGIDEDNDGIGDTPYNIPGGSNQDMFPYMKQNGWFKHASFTENFDDYGIDTDSDELYNHLVIEVEVNVSKAGEYELSGNLAYRINISGWYWWHLFDYESNNTYLDIGTHIISLQFQGYKIYDIGYNGTLKASLELYDITNGNWMDDAEYMTQSYNSDEFDGPPIKFTEVFNDYGLDTDGDGLYNYLAVEAEVNVTELGEYHLSGSLRYYDNFSGWWNTIDYDSNYTTLDIGTHTILLRFDGYKIYNIGYNGQFKADLDLYTIDDAEYMTQSYNYYEFDGPPIEFTGVFDDYGLDTDGDGLYDYLAVEAEVNVTEPGEYRLSGYLYYYNDSLGWWEWFDCYAYNYTYLNVGIHDIVLQFEGYKIYNIEYNGQFKADLNLYDIATGNWVGDAEYMTQPYAYTDFQPPPGQFTGNYNDYGLDTDDDGLYDYLVVEAEANVSEAGDYRLSGDLAYLDYFWWDNFDYDSNSTYLNIGVHTITLRFKGYKIYNLAYNGTFKVDLNLYKKNDGIFWSWNWIDDEYYITQSYNYTAFERPPAKFTENYNDYGLDTDGDGLYDYLVVEAEVNVSEASDYRLSADLYYYNESLEYWYWFDYESNNTYLDIGTYIISLQFQGYKIYDIGYNGTLKASLELYDITNGNWMDDAEYMTQSYNYYEFDGPPIEFTGVFDDYGLDTDGDGLYDYLVVEVEVNVTEQGEYELSGSLRYYDNSSGWWYTIEYDYNYSTLDIGIHTLLLRFDGYKIYNIGYSGQFKADLDLYTIDGWNWIDDAEYTTQSYNYYEFDGPPIEFTGNFNDYGLDTDQDELYDYLVVEVEVNVTEQGEYELSGNLYYYNDYYGFWNYCCYTYNYTHLNEGIQTISIQFDTLYISRDIWSLQYNNSFKIKLYLYYEWQQVDYAEYITKPYNYSLFPEPDVTPPVIINVVVPDYVGLDHPGDICANVSDNNLYQVYIILSDNNYITFNQSLVIWYYLNDSGLDGTYSVRNYSGNYAKLQQGNKSDPITYFIFSNWNSSEKIYSHGYFLKNQTSEMIPIFVEFNLSDGTLYNIAMYSFSESGKIELEYIDYMIESGESIFYSISLIGESPGMILQNNYTLYSIGDLDNPFLSWCSLGNGEYNGMINAIDKVYNSNSTNFNLTVYHGPQTNTPPIADASAGEPYLGFVGEEITFDGSLSYDPDGYITSWSWDFGDGINGSGEITLHTYFNSGTFNATLTVTDNENATDLCTTTAVVILPNRPPSTPELDGPTVGIKNTEYTYTVVSTDEDNDTINYIFDWGDGNTSTSEFLPSGTPFSINHSWSATGTYIISVQAHDNMSYSGTTELPVSIYDELPSHMGIIPSSDTISVGEEFTTIIYIDPVEPIGGWQIYEFNFTQGIVNATEIIPGAFWETNFDPGDVDNENGTITDVQVWSLGPYPDINHTACMINLTALQLGICTFEIMRVDITNDNFEDIPVIIHTAMITVVDNMPPFVYDEYPQNESIDVERPPSELNVTIEDPNDDAMNIYIKWRKHDYYHFGELVTLASYTGVYDGTYNFIPPTENDWIWGDTTYVWSVNVTDGIVWINETYQYTTGGSRYDVNNNDLVNFQDAGLVWIHRTSEVYYDGIYDVNQDGQVNFQDAGLTWINRS